MPRVRTTIRPDQVIEVDEHELSELRTLGIVHAVEDEPTATTDAGPKPATSKEK
jgi:hypothetical protein